MDYIPLQKFDIEDVCYVTTMCGSSCWTDNRASRAKLDYTTRNSHVTYDRKEAKTFLIYTDSIFG